MPIVNRATVYKAGDRVWLSGLPGAGVDKIRAFRSLLGDWLTPMDKGATSTYEIVRVLFPELTQATLHLQVW